MRVTRKLSRRDAAVECLLGPAMPFGFGQAARTAGHGYLAVRVEDVKWEKLEPDWAPIRHPRAMHIPRHWHTANETHTIVKGTYVFECDGKRDKLGPGSFNYLPGKMIHQAWAPDASDIMRCSLVSTRPAEARRTRTMSSLQDAPLFRYTSVESRALGWFPGSRRANRPKEGSPTCRKRG